MWTNSGKRTGLAVAVVGLCLGAGPVLAPAHAADQSRQDKTPQQMASLAVGDHIHARSRIALPPVLEAADIERYRRIFAIQKDGAWDKADAIIQTLENPVLLGHVLEQRYMHPDKYRSAYKELKDWLELYYDHPQARRVYKLALRRRPPDWKYPAKPHIPSLTYHTPGHYAPLPGKQLSAANRRKVRQLRRRIKHLTAHGQTLAAKRMIQSAQVKKLFSDAQYDEARARLGFRYFIDGRDEWALEWAGKAAARSSELIPEANWAAGLAAYRLDRLTESANYFETLARSDNVSPWLASAGGFWAGRVHMLNKSPARVTPVLMIAAKHFPTFYGALARRVLGQGLDMDWQAATVEQKHLLDLVRRPRGSRASALVQVGQYGLAERELRNEAAASNDIDHVNCILAFAVQANMSQLALRLDELFFPDNGFDVASYPVPRWVPEGGYTIDPALVFALIRQESRFNPGAKSRVGAHGLMQLMPATASFVARDRRYKNSRRKELLDPELNLSLGQRYIEILRDDAKIEGSLIKMVAAWNGGPGNVNKWGRNQDYRDDPLLFMESIPARETRIFVERVMANLWIYRDRFGQEAPSLTALASGQWPLYTSVAPRTESVTETRNLEADTVADRTID